MCLASAILISSMFVRADEPALPSEVSQLRKQVKQLSARVAQLEQQLRIQSDQAGAAAMRWKAGGGRVVPIPLAEGIPIPFVPNRPIWPEYAVPRMPTYATPVLPVYAPHPAYNTFPPRPIWHGVEGGMKLDALERAGKWKLDSSR